MGNLMTATVFEAKTKLSELIKRAQAGEEIIITSGRDKKPVAQLHAFDSQQPVRLGAMLTPGFELGAAFWEPLPEGWDGEGNDSADPLLQPFKNHPARPEEK
jgi:antitoxin (DNA-binding transcriptional repressor) of toxin-antitoxin stability system